MGERTELRSETNENENSINSNSKRKIEEIQLAKQKAQEIASRLISNAELKRPRLDTHSSEPLPYSNPLSHPLLTDNALKFSGQPMTNSQVGSVPFATQLDQYHGLQCTSKKISIPNGKVGVIIGRGGETIKYLQLQSGAKIQITKDSDTDPYSLTRDVELMGTTEQISKAEQLINEVIAEADSGGSAPSANRGFNSMQPGSEQFIMKVPNNKVAMLIGKGGETIRNLQNRSGACVQIIPLHLPPGDTSTERTVHINGLKEQIESAKELIDEIVRENRSRNPSGPSSYVQPVYPPPGNWGPPGQPLQQLPPGYGYAPPGTYPTRPSYYGNYPTQQAGWDQSNPSPMPPSQQSTGYDYYGQKDQTESAPLNLSYSNSQTPPTMSYSYDQGFSQQPPSHGQGVPSQAPSLNQQKPYVTPGYGPLAPSSQPDGSTPVQSAQPLPAYSLGYNQPMAIPQAGYGTSIYTGPPPSQPGYCYAGQQLVQVPPVSAEPIWEQNGYPPQAAPAPTNYVQGTNPPVYGQTQLQPLTQSQPATHGISQPLAYGAEKTGDGNSAPGYDLPPLVQESVHSQS